MESVLFVKHTGHACVCCVVKCILSNGIWIHDDDSNTWWRFCQNSWHISAFTGADSIKVILWSRFNRNDWLTFGGRGSVRQVGKGTWQRTFSWMETATGGQGKQLARQRNPALVQTRQLDWQASVRKETRAFVHGQPSIPGSARPFWSKIISQRQGEADWHAILWGQIKIAMHRSRGCTCVCPWI